MQFSKKTIATINKLCDDISYYEDYKVRLVDFIFAEKDSIEKDDFLKLIDELNNVNQLIHKLKIQKKALKYHDQEKRTT
jgi:hypothetical protein